MLTKLLSKEEKYFSDFREMISYVHQIGDITNELFTAEVPDQSIILNLKPLKIGCEDILSKIVTRLNETYVTPIYREDICTLAEKINNISNILIRASSSVETYNIIKKIKYADQLTNIILQQLIELELVIRSLKIQKADECKAVNDLKVQANNIYQNAMHELFAAESDVFDIIKKKEILELLKNASDECQSAMDAILTIFIKNVT